MAYIDDPTTQKANLSFIKASMRTPLLSREREFELAQRWHEGGDTGLVVDSASAAVLRCAAEPTLGDAAAQAAALARNPAKSSMPGSAAWSPW